MFDLEQKRSRYPSPLEYLVDSHSVTPAQLSVRSMNFGQLWRTQGIQVREYKVTLPIQFFIDILEKEVPAFVDDAKKHPDINSAFENTLRIKGWPTVSKIITDHQLASIWLASLDTPCF